MVRLTCFAARLAVMCLTLCRRCAAYDDQIPVSVSTAARLVGQHCAHRHHSPASGGAGLTSEAALDAARGAYAALVADRTILRFLYLADQATDAGKRILGRKRGDRPGQGVKTKESGRAG
jgi:hypothetical protein